jgi:hypothetical protein
LLFDVGEVLGMEDDAGELVAAAVLTRYRPSTAVISMVLVASRLERRGLGTRLMTHLLDHAGPGPVYLYATENGRPLYEKVGVATIDAMTTYVGRFDPSDGATGAPVSRAARTTTSRRSSPATRRPSDGCPPGSLGKSTGPRRELRRKAPGNREESAAVRAAPARSAGRCRRCRTCAPSSPSLRGAETSAEAGRGRFARARS